MKRSCRLSRTFNPVLLRYFGKQLFIQKKNIPSRNLRRFKRKLSVNGIEQWKSFTNKVTWSADHVKATGLNIKRDHFDILASVKTDYHCKIKETLFIQELHPALNAKVSSEKLLLY